LSEEFYRRKRRNFKPRKMRIKVKLLSNFPTKDLKRRCIYRNRDLGFIMNDRIVIIIGMKEDEEAKTREAFSDLAFLQAQHLVPPQMLSKLQYLSSLIRGDQVP
jgi:hypothetical protein